MFRKSLLASLALVLCSSVAHAEKIFPINRATILVGSKFDFKVEFASEVKPDDVKITVNGKDYAEVLGGKATFTAKEADSEGSAMMLRDVTIASPGTYTVEATAGGEMKKVVWDVFATPATPKVKNIIFLLGDGMTVAHRTGARIMSKGVTEGKANGRLNMDDLDHMAFIGTSSVDSIAVDSANSMSAYMTGHKSSINAIGVYADRTKDSLDDPRVENIAEALRRTGGKSLGIVSPAEIEDATPAAVVSHTRRRADKAVIAEQMFALKPEVVLGGGSAYFLPQKTPGSKRKDDKDIFAMYKDAGYKIATTKTELEETMKGSPDKLVGLFHTGNMDVALDRLQLKKGTVDKFPDQPGLVEMAKAALEILSKDEDGFFLMVEGASIDKMAHPLDFDRSLFETIEFDQAVGVAREFAKTHPDTLIIATADHTHGDSIIGTIDYSKPGDDMREKVGTYADAGFPDYADADGDGFPDTVDVKKRLAMFANNYPDYYETFRPHLEGPLVPAIENEKKEYVANEAYKDVPGAVLRIGNLPRSADTAVHAVDDVVLQATGPGAEELKGYMEESDVYRVLADAFALGAPKAK